MPSTVQFAAPPLASICGGSVSAYDRDHVQSLVSVIAEVAGAYTGGVVCLHGMTLPYANSGDAHDGYMEFRIEMAGLKPLAFSVEFGGKEHDRFGFGEVTLEALQEAAEVGDAVNHMASVINFDELWLFACVLVERMALSSISVAFGGLGGL